MRRLQKNPTPWLAWPDADELAEAYKNGTGAWRLYHEYQHPYLQIKAYLQHLGIWRDKSEAQMIRQRRERLERGAQGLPNPLRPAVDPWVRAELDAIAPPPSSALRGFAPMLAVSVKDGVLLDRIAEALEPFDRFPVRRLEA